MEGLEALGNVGVIPIVIFLTQMIKQKIGDFKYGTDVLALILSFVLCVGWEFYYMSPMAYMEWQALNGLAFFKWIVSSILLVGFGTWLSASKIYDLGHGDKKRERSTVKEKTKLQEEIIKLKNGNGGQDDQVEEDPLVSDKLRAILEG